MYRSVRHTPMTVADQSDSHVRAGDFVGTNHSPAQVPQLERSEVARGTLAADLKLVSYTHVKVLG